MAKRYGGQNPNNLTQHLAPGASYKYGAPNQIWRHHPNLAPQKVKNISTQFCKNSQKTQKFSKNS